MATHDTSRTEPTAASAAPLGGGASPRMPRAFRALGALRVVVRLALVALFGVAGVQHLTNPTFFHPQYPTFLPAPDPTIRVFGVFFLAGALGLLGPPRVRRGAALGLVVLLLVVWPGNWWGALQPTSYVVAGGPKVFDWIRVPFQLVWIAAVVWANRDVLTAPVVVRARTNAAPAVVLAGLTDFTPRRPQLFATLDPARYQVHALRDTSAEVTEGARPPGPLERERYDWSHPGEVRVETLESTDFRPGSTWLYRLAATPGGGTEVELTVDRAPVTAKARLVTALGWFLGRAVLRRDLRRTLTVVQEPGR